MGALAGTLCSIVEGDVKAVYLHGSAVLGGRAATSDVDVLLVVSRQLVRDGGGAPTGTGCPGDVLARRLALDNGQDSRA